MLGTITGSQLTIILTTEQGLRETARWYKEHGWV